MNTAHQTRILIAGDTSRWRDALKDALPVDGIIVSFGIDFVDVFTASLEDGRQPNIYILANKMPDEDDGLRFLREFRQDGCHEPVIICSTHVTPEASAEISRLDGIHINWKPAEATNEITTIIERLMAT